MHGQTRRGEKGRTLEIFCSAHRMSAKSRSSSRNHQIKTSHLSTTSSSLSCERRRASSSDRFVSSAPLVSRQRLVPACSPPARSSAGSRLNPIRNPSARGHGQPDNTYNSPGRRRVSQYLKVVLCDAGEQSLRHYSVPRGPSWRRRTNCRIRWQRCLEDHGRRGFAHALGISLRGLGRSLCGLRRWS